jgi:hypothetical protein
MVVLFPIRPASIVPTTAAKIKIADNACTSPVTPRFTEL